MSQNSFFRIVDAAANRTAEGLRVAEDVMRMHLNDRHLAKQLKQLRHDLTETLANLPAANSIAARDSVGDVGRNLQVKQEYDRSTDDKTTDRSNSYFCLLYTSPSPRDKRQSRMPSSA